MSFHYETASFPRTLQVRKLSAHTGNSFASTSPKRKFPSEVSPAYAFEQSCFKKLWQLSPENTPGILLLPGPKDKHLVPGPVGGDPSKADCWTSPPAPVLHSLVPMSSLITRGIPRSSTCHEGGTQSCSFLEESHLTFTLRQAPLSDPGHPSGSHTDYRLLAERGQYLT